MTLSIFFSVSKDLFKLKSTFSNEFDSSSNTSKHAPDILPTSNASTKSFKTTDLPLAELIKINCF